MEDVESQDHDHQDADEEDVHGSLEKDDMMSNEVKPSEDQYSQVGDHDHNKSCSNNNEEHASEKTNKEVKPHSAQTSQCSNFNETSTVCIKSWR